MSLRAGILMSTTYAAISDTEVLRHYQAAFVRDASRPGPQVTALRRSGWSTVQ